MQEAGVPVAIMKELMPDEAAPAEGADGAAAPAAEEKKE